jgi:hypothetical protein
MSRRYNAKPAMLKEPHRRTKTISNSAALVLGQLQRNEK